jgi:hypothetical protein
MYTLFVNISKNGDVPAWLRKTAHTYVQWHMMHKAGQSSVRTCFENMVFRRESTRIVVR